MTQAGRLKFSSEHDDFGLHIPQAVGFGELYFGAESLPEDNYPISHRVQPCHAGRTIVSVFEKSRVMLSVC